MISQDRLKKILRMPPGQIARKVWDKVRAALALYHERRRDHNRSTYIGHDAVPVRLTDDFSVSLLPNLLRKHEEAIRRLADKHLDHQFNLLGSGWVRVEHGMPCRGVESHFYDSGPALKADRSGRWLRGRVNAANLREAQRVWSLVDAGYQPIDWHLDFKSGFRWREDTNYRDIRYAHLPGVDVKVPWELSRMQHLPSLALAFALDPSKDVYRREFRNQILDFIASNPPRFGVNWTCTMDVAIRVANWLLAYDLFHGAGVVFDEAFRAEFTRSVYQHGVHIINNLEWNEHLRSNHYLADIVGLLFVATHLSASPETDTWLAFAVQELIKETATQFHPEGSNFEASTCYHRLSGDMLAYATALVLGLPRHRGASATPQAETSLPAWYLERLAKVGEVVMGTTHPDGSSVQIGDNDSGRFVTLDDDYPLDLSGLVAALDGLFHRNDFAQFTGGQRLEREIITRLAKGVTIPSTPEPTNAYPQFGVYILRSPNIAAWVRCGSVGQNGNGGHAHDDQLSFELSIDGVRLIVDPGTYLYTPVPALRNRFRSSAMHNTLTLAEGEQHSFLAGVDSLFSMHDPEKTETLSCSEQRFVGRRQNSALVHQRTMQVDGDCLQGIDECATAGTKRVHFHLAPGVAGRVAADGTGVELMPPGGQAFELRGGPGVCVTDSLYSPAYGVVEKNQVVTLTFSDSRCEWRIGRSG